MRLAVFLLLVLYPAVVFSTQDWRDNQNTNGHEFVSDVPIEETVNAPAGIVITNHSNGTSALAWFKAQDIGGAAVSISAAPASTGSQTRFNSLSNGLVITDSTAIAFAQAVYPNPASLVGLVQFGTTAGAPSGVPTVLSGQWPMVIDSTDARLYFYDSGRTAWEALGQFDNFGPAIMQTSATGIHSAVTIGSHCSFISGVLDCTGTGGGGTVTSVNGTAGQILCTPASPNPVCSLVAAGTAGSCTNCSVTFDALGRETARSSGTAPVLTVTGTAQHVSVSPTTVNPVVDLIGGFVSGDVVAGAQDLGLLTTGLDKLTVTAGVAAMSTAVAGTDYTVSVSGTPPVNVGGAGGVRIVSLSTDTTLKSVIGNLGAVGVNDGSGAPWLTSGTWANNQAMITSGGTWTTTNECNVFSSCPAGGGLSGTYPNPTVASVACSALPAFIGDITKASGSCATVDTNKGKIYVDATDAAAHSPDYLYPKLTSFTSTISFSPIGTGDGQVTFDVVPGTTGQSATYFYNWFNLAPGAGTHYNYPAIAGQINQAASGFTVYEYAPAFIEKFVRLAVSIPSGGNDLGGPAANMMFVATRNGSTVTTVTVPIGLATFGVFDSGAVSVGSGAATDTWGLTFQTDNTSVGGSFTGNATLRVYQ